MCIHARPRLFFVLFVHHFNFLIIFKVFNLFIKFSAKLDNHTSQFFIWRWILHCFSIFHAFYCCLSVILMIDFINNLNFQWLVIFKDTNKWKFDKFQQQICLNSVRCQYLRRFFWLISFFFKVKDFLKNFKVQSGQHGSKLILEKNFSKQQQLT